MFLVKAGTTIQIQVPKSCNYFYWSSWIPYTTKEDKIYDKEEVWDIAAVHNGRADVPEWASHNIIEFNRVVIQRNGKYALVYYTDIEYLD